MMKDKILETVAEKIATDAHKGQFRKGNQVEYIEHPKAVANNLRERKYSSVVIAVGLLHDTVEDTPVTYTDIDDALLKVGISNLDRAQVIAAVYNLTKLPKGTETYVDYLKRVASDPISKLVKLADLEHNMSDLSDGNLKQKYELTEYVLKNGGIHTDMSNCIEIYKKVTGRDLTINS